MLLSVSVNSIILLSYSITFGVAYSTVDAAAASPVIWYGQHFQDRIVIEEIFALHISQDHSHYQRYFVDLGAGNGITRSNTLALERYFG